MSNCYNCLMRENIPSNAHSCCKALRHKAPHPNDPGVIKLEVHLSLGLVDLKSNEGEELIRIDPYGRKNGWANWPLDFDPHWISNCKLYLPKDPEFEKI